MKPLISQGFQPLRKPLSNEICVLEDVYCQIRATSHSDCTRTEHSVHLKSTLYRPFPHVNEKARSHTSQMTTVLVRRSPIGFDETLSWKGSRSTYSCSEAYDGLFDTFFTYISLNTLKSMQFSMEATLSGSPVVLRWLTSKQGMDAPEEFWLERLVGSLTPSGHCHH